MPFPARLAPALLAALLLVACKPAEPVSTGNTGAVAEAPTPAPSATPAAAPAIALEALSEADQLTLGTGCSCSFVHGDDTLLEVANNKVAMRIGGKLETCAISEDQATALSGGTGTFECAGYTVAMKGKGEVEHGKNDDSGRDATLTISRGDQSRAYDGAMACAC